MLTALLLAAAALQDLKEITRTLERADDKAGYEAGAYQAAKDLAGMGGVEAMELRLRLFDDKMETYRGVYLRDWFYSGMQRFGDLEEAELLIDAARSKKSSELLRTLCLRALALGSGPVPAKELLGPGFSRAPEPVRREWQHTLGALLEGGRLDFGKRPPKDPRAEVLEKLIGASPLLTGLMQVDDLSREQILFLVDAAGNSKDPGDRAELLRGMVGRGDVSRSYLLALIRDGLRDPETGPRTAAIHAAARGRVYDSAGLLVQALEDAEGRFVAEIVDALVELTGQRLGWSPKIWRRWWEERGGEWLVRARAGQLDDSDRGAGTGADEERTAAFVFGIPVDSKRIAILVDGSGSMLADKLGDRTCAEAAAAELDLFLGQLPEDARFEVVVIGDEPVRAFGRLTAANSKSRAKAIAFLEEFDFGGTSALYDVLVAAQRISEVDTIVLISDGGGSSGSHQFAGHMLDGLKREFQRTGVRIHGICVGKDAPKVRFMKDLAAATGGIMTQPSG